jgi:hypothetical protein
MIGTLLIHIGQTPLIQGKKIIAKINISSISHENTIVFGE